jgi:hypothetical protein
MAQVRKTRTQFIADCLLWAFMIAVVFTLIVGSANAQPIQPDAVTVVEKPPVNRNVKKYHKANKKQFKCSACPDKGIKKFLPKKWRK